MKRFAEAYMSFTRAERMGIICLGGLLILLILFRISIPYWARPEFNRQEEERLSSAWAVYQRSQPRKNTTDTTLLADDGYADVSDGDDTPLPSVIDINTADSATLVRLKGIGPVTAGKIIARIKTQGPFTNIDQLLEVRSFPKSTFELLKKHLSVSGNKN